MPRNFSLLGSTNSYLTRDALLVTSHGQCVNQLKSNQIESFVLDYLVDVL